MSDLHKLKLKILKFRDDRNWKQFHNAKDVALSLSLEAAELLEHFQWISEKDLPRHIAKNKQSIEDELADIFYWVLLLSHDLGIDIEDALQKKIRKNEIKYPVSKSKGRATKYDKL